MRTDIECPCCHGVGRVYVRDLSRPQHHEARYHEYPETLATCELCDGEGTVDEITADAYTASRARARCHRR